MECPPGRRLQRQGRQWLVTVLRSAGSAWWGFRSSALRPIQHTSPCRALWQVRHPAPRCSNGSKLLSGLHLPRGRDLQSEPGPPMFHVEHRGSRNVPRGTSDSGVLQMNVSRGTSWSGMFHVEHRGQECFTWNIGVRNVSRGTLWLRECSTWNIGPARCDSSPGSASPGTSGGTPRPSRTSMRVRQPSPPACDRRRMRSARRSWPRPPAVALRYG